MNSKRSPIARGGCKTSRFSAKSIYGQKTFLRLRRQKGYIVYQSGVKGTFAVSAEPKLVPPTLSKDRSRLKTPPGRTATLGWRAGRTATLVVVGQVGGVIIIISRFLHLFHIFFHLNIITPVQAFHLWGPAFNLASELTGVTN